MTLPPSNNPFRPLEKPDPKQSPARGTRSTGYGDAAGAPVAPWPEGEAEGDAVVARAAPAAPAKPAQPPPAVTPAQKLVTPPAPGRTVPKSVVPAPRPPVAVKFPPEELRAECEDLTSRYPDRVAALLPILHLAQKKLGGWISPELEAGIAAYLGCSDQHVRGVVTFYTMFNTKPVGRHHVQVCRTLSCWLRGAADLTKCLERKTGLRPGETGKDLRFTVSEVECIGLCEVAPAIFVNDDEHVSLTPKSLEALLDTLT